MALLPVPCLVAWDNSILLVADDIWWGDQKNYTEHTNIRETGETNCGWPYLPNGLRQSNNVSSFGRYGHTSSSKQLNKTTFYFGLLRLILLSCVTIFISTCHDGCRNSDTIVQSLRRQIPWACRWQCRIKRRQSLTKPCQKCWKLRDYFL